jgi:hypothetical protein
MAVTDDEIDAPAIEDPLQPRTESARPILNQSEVIPASVEVESPDPISPILASQPPALAHEPLASAPTTDASSRPWLPLALVVAGLCMSVGANLFLTWVTWDTRRHYRNLVRHAAR